MKPITSKPPRITISPITAPITKVPTSSMNIFAGYQLKKRNAIHDAINGADKSITNGRLWAYPIKKRNSETIAANPASNPLYPANVFVTFVTAIIPIGIRIKR